MISNLENFSIFDRIFLMCRRILFPLTFLQGLIWPGFYSNWPYFFNYYPFFIFWKSPVSNVYSLPLRRLWGTLSANLVQNLVFLISKLIRITVGNYSPYISECYLAQIKVKIYVTRYLTHFLRNIPAGNRNLLPKKIWQNIRR